MDKTAQRRGPINRSREWINDAPDKITDFFKSKKYFAEPSKEESKKFFEIELKRVMNDLKKADNNIRAILIGEKVDDSNVPVDGKPIKEILKSARKNFNRREYLTSVAELGMFHKKMFDVKKYIDTLNLSIEKIHHNFLNPPKGTPAWEHLKSLQEHMSSLADDQSEYFIKEAGVSDIMNFFHNMVSPRGRSLAAWEKQYPGIAKDLREGAATLLDHADSLLSNTLSLLKEMATARATRQPDDYMMAARKIQSEFNKFDNGKNGFRNYYETVVKPYLARQAEYEKEEAKAAGSPPATPPAVDVPGAQELGKEEVGKPQDSSQMQLPFVSPGKKQTLLPPVLEMPPPPATTQKDVNVPTGAEEPAIKYRVDPNAPKKPETQIRVVQHHQFMESLEKMSNEHPRIVASFISKYATSIQSKDPEKAIELFTIAKRLKG